MGSPSRKRVTKHTAKEAPAPRTPATTQGRVQDAASLLRAASRQLEETMRLIAEATLLSPGLDEQLGIEAQRLIGVRDAVRAEIKALEVLRLRETD